MTNDKGIFIQNIYYMLSYAFRVLQQKNYEEIAGEKFDEIQDLFAAILAKGISQQLKQGLHREYISVTESLSVMRGKLDINGTIINEIQYKKAISCERDELSVNNIFNRILKTTALILMRCPQVRPENRQALKKVMLFFDEVDIADPLTIRWNTLRYQRNNRNYEMLMNMCYFILDGMLLTTERGTYKITDFSDKHMHRLYERFVLEYIKRHHSYLTEIRAARIKWNLSEETEENMIRFLPEMQTDVFLRMGDRILIIDTKYYGKTLVNHYDKYTLRSDHIYQIFTYVKNQDVMCTGNVSGMLLYAKTDEDISPDCEFVMGGNRISVKTLDLNKKFELIAEQLNKIVKDHFGIKKVAKTSFI